MYICPSGGVAFCTRLCKIVMLLFGVVFGVSFCVLCIFCRHRRKTVRFVRKGVVFFCKVLHFSKGREAV